MTDTEVRSERTIDATRLVGQRPHASQNAYRKWSALVIIVIVAAVGLAACGGTDSPHAPHVASLGTSTTVAHSHGNANTATTQKNGNATQLMDEWAACMRTHGDPNQTDPTIDQYGVINITVPPAHGANTTISSEAHGTTGPCSRYELAAENDLRSAYPVAPPPSQAQQVQYTDCMRTHGVPNYPDPGPNGETSFRGTGVDPNSPSVENANRICGKQINAPAWWIAGTGPPGDVSVQSAGIGPNGPTGGLSTPTGGDVVPKGSNGGTSNANDG